MIRATGYASGFILMVAGFTTPSWILGVVLLAMGMEAVLLGRRWEEVKHDDNGNP